MPLKVTEVIPNRLYWTDSKSPYGGTSVVKVVKSKSSGFPYGKLLTYGKNDDGSTWAKFEYKPSLIYCLERMMTIDEAITFGKAFGFCCVCGRLLTNSKSIELGIGPKCRGYF